jgi:hypothetical protein
MGMTRYLVGLEGYMMRKLNASSKRLDLLEEYGKVMSDGSLLSALVEGTRQLLGIPFYKETNFEVVGVVS